MGGMTRSTPLPLIARAACRLVLVLLALPGDAAPASDTPRVPPRAQAPETLPRITARANALPTQADLLDLTARLAHDAAGPPRRPPRVTPADFGFEPDFHHVARFDGTDYFLARSLPLAANAGPYHTIVAIHAIGDDEAIDFLFYDKRRGLIAESKTMSMIYGQVLESIVASPRYSEAYGTAIHHYTSNTRLPDVSFPPGSWRVPTKSHRHVAPISSVWYARSRDELNRARWEPINVVRARHQRRSISSAAWSRPNALFPEESYFPVNSYREAVAYRRYMAALWSNRTLFSGHERWRHDARELHAVLETMRDEFHPTRRRVVPEYDPSMEIELWSLREQTTLCLFLFDAAVARNPQLGEDLKAWQAWAAALPDFEDPVRKPGVARPLMNRLRTEEGEADPLKALLRCRHIKNLEYSFEYLEDNRRAQTPATPR